MRGFIVGCTAGLLLWMTACAQQVEFPLDYYSFVEIAQRMSVEGRKVDCARDLQQRLAVIHLKPCRWQQARETLEAGLDIRFRRTSEAENRWILERNPEVLRQEKRWREQLAAYMERQRDRDAKLLRLLLDKKISVEELIKTFTTEYLDDEVLPENISREQLEKQMRPLIEAVRKMPIDAALRDWRAFQRMRQQSIQFLQKDTTNVDENDPFGDFYRQFIAEHPITSFGFSQEVLDWAHRAATDERDETLKNFRELMGSMDESVPDNPQLIEALMLSMLGDFVQGYGQAWARDTIMQQLRPPLTALEAIEQGCVLREYVVTLTPEQLAWHLNDVEGKLIPLDSTMPVQAPLIATANWQRDSFSTRYECPNTQSDDFSSFLSANRIEEYAVVRWERRRLKRTLERIDPELLRAFEKALDTHNQLARQSPITQPITTLHNRSAPLAEVVYRWAQEHKQEIVMEVHNLHTDAHKTLKGSLAQQMENSNTPYLLEQRDGVWILRCWTAFVDRVVDYPYAAIRDLMRSDFGYEAWRAFYHTVSSEQARWLMHSPYDLFWNPTETPEAKLPAFPIKDLSAAWLIMLILESLPAEVRAQFWNPPEDAPPPTIALMQLPLETRTRLLQTLTLWRAPLLNFALLQGRERFLPPSAWLERLRLVRRTPYGWIFELTPLQPTDSEDTERPFMASQLPGKPLNYDVEHEAELMLDDRDE
ncbi:MAG: hypothetical protein KatS3mg019_0136 [Fimbriimonadales bacterium]|nr:MAG: hypothetical protein KatS3mg019_0136 [Fimbriimonadales bacterium]